MIRWLYRLFLPMSVLILGAAAWLVPLPYFLERPGTMLNLAEVVAIEDEDVGEVDGEFLLTSVNLRRATTLRLLVGWLEEETEVVPDRRFLPVGIDDETYFERQRAVFATTADVASALGLQTAGYPVDPNDLTGDGALVVSTLPGTPAEGVLESGDVITAVDGRQVRTSGDLSGAVEEGDTLRVEFTRGGRERRVDLTPEVRDVDGEERPVIGVQIETLHPRIRLPVPVDVDSGRIGGPSAGLMIALTVYDMVSRDDLAAGRRVAGSGAIDASGVVRAVGGVPRKVRAADSEGADVFLVPATQLADAEGAVSEGSSMTIVGVATFDEAVRALEATEDREAGGPAGPPDTALAA